VEKSVNISNDTSKTLDDVGRYVKSSAYLTLGGCSQVTRQDAGDQRSENYGAE
jgi:hypothetical protein